MTEQTQRFSYSEILIAFAAAIAFINNRLSRAGSPTFQNGVHALLVQATFMLEMDEQGNLSLVFEQTRLFPEEPLVVRIPIKEGTSSVTFGEGLPYARELGFMMASLATIIEGSPSRQFDITLAGGTTHRLMSFNGQIEERSTTR